MGLMNQLGQSDIAVHPVALGTAGFGWNISGTQATAQLNRFAELGGNLIDTADSYSAGRAEQVIGTWMRTAGTRDRMVIATKVGKNLDAAGLSARSIVAAVDASLERLQTDRIDVLYFHAEDDEVSLEESLSAAAELIRQGKVRVLGASNFSPASLTQARILASQGLPRFEVATANYSLLNRKAVEGELSLVCAAQEVSIAPYFALANGYLGHLRDRRVRAGDSTHLRAAHSHDNRHGHRVLQALDDVAISHGVDISTVALAWLLDRPQVAATAVGCDSISDLEALMHAPTLHLTSAQIAALTKASN